MPDASFPILVLGLGAVSFVTCAVGSDQVGEEGHDEGDEQGEEVENIFLFFVKASGLLHVSVSF